MAPQTRSMSKRPQQSSDSTSSSTVIRPRIGKARLPNPRFRLLDLPQELIDMIYVQTILGGDMAILRTSREVHERASYFVPQNAVYRMVLGYGSSNLTCHSHPLEGFDSDRRVHDAKPLSSSMISRIQNIEIRICPQEQPLRIRNARKKYRYSTPVYHFKRAIRSPIGAFTTSDFHRRTCHIHVEIILFDDSMFDLIETVRQLTGFETLMIQFEAGTARTTGPTWKDDDMNDEISPFFDMMGKLLCPTLGPAVLDNRGLEEEPCLSFCPLSFGSGREANRLGLR